MKFPLKYIAVAAPLCVALGFFTGPEPDAQLPPLSPQVEANIERAMPQAYREFGKKDTKSWHTFWRKKQLFEQPDGFQSEVEMEAAYRVLND